MRSTNPITKLYVTTSTSAKYGFSFALLVVLFLVLSFGNEKAAESSYVRTAEVPLPDTGSSSNSSALIEPPVVETVVDRSADANCGDWSSSLFNVKVTSKRTRWKKVTLGDGHVQLNWEHDRSGAPSAVGVLHASVYYSTNKCPDEWSPKQLNKPATMETVLCANHGQSVSPPGAGSTIVLNLQGLILGEVLKQDPINLWHYHAVLFRFWAGVQIASNIARTVNLNAPEWIVILLPEKSWSPEIFGNGNVFVPSPENLLKALNPQNQNLMDCLQGLSDAFSGRVVLARVKVSIETLRSVLEEHKASTDIEMWVTPPEDGLMWDLAWDSKLSDGLAGCHNSILLQYRNDMLNSLQPQEIPKVARHVCVVSRQERGLRNLTPEFMLKMLGRLGAPLILSPKTSPRTAGKLSNGFPLHLDKSSVSGQMRFVYHECAVLLGVHGAGLTNAMALRPGTSVIELHTRSMNYQYFRNVAALTEDVDYSVFVVKGDGASGKQELNMYTDEEGLQALYDLITTKLEDSMRRQALHHSD